MSGDPEYAPTSATLASVDPDLRGADVDCHLVGIRADDCRGNMILASPDV